MLVARVLIHFLWLSFGADAARVHLDVARAQMASVLSPTQTTSLTCENVVPNAISISGTSPFGDVSCKCPILNGLTGEDEACPIGLRDFDPSKLDGKGCECVPLGEVFVEFLTDLFAGIGEDINKNINTMQGWVTELGNDAVAKATQLESKWAAIKEGVANNVEKLKADFTTATADGKKQILAKIKAVQDELAKVRTSLERYVTNSVSRAKTDAQRQFSTLKTEITKAVGEKQKLLVRTADGFHTRVLEMSASVMDNIPSMQSIELSTELMAERAGELGEEATEFANLFNSKLTSQIADFEEQLKLLQAAAVNKGAEIGAGAARFMEVTSSRIGELKEQIKTAADGKKQEMTTEIEKLKSQLSSFQVQANQQRASLRLKIGKFVEGLSENIGELQERYNNAWFWEKPSLDLQKKQFKKRLNTLRKAAFGKQAEVQAHVELVISSVSERIGSLQEQLKTAVGEKQVLLEESITNLKAMQKQLKDQAQAKHVIVKEQVATAKGIISANIVQTQEQIKTAKLDAKKALDKQLKNYQSVLSQLDSVTTNMKEDLEDTIKAVLVELRATLQDYPSDSTIESDRTMNSEISTLIGQFQEQLNNLAVDAQAAAGECVAFLAQYIGSLKQGKYERTGGTGTALLQVQTNGVGITTRLMTKLKTWLGQLQAAPANVLGQVTELFATVGALVAEKVGKYTAALVALSESWWPPSLLEVKTMDEKSVLDQALQDARAQLAQMRTVTMNIKAAYEEQLAGAIETVGEKLGVLKETIAAAVAEKGVYAREVVDSLQSSLSVLKTSAGQARSALESELMEVSAAVSTQVGQFQKKLTGAFESTGSLAEKKQKQFQKYVTELGSTLSGLRAAAAEKGYEAMDQLTTTADSISERIGQVREQVKIGVGSQKAQMQMRLETLQARLEQIQTAGQGMVGQVQEQVGDVAASTSMRIGELKEQLLTAAQDKKSALIAEKAKLETRLERLRASATLQYQSKVEAATTLMETRISSLKTTLATASAGAKAKAQKKIDELTEHIALLKEVVADRKLAIQELLGQVIKNMQTYVAELQGMAKAAAGTAKTSLERRTGEVQGYLTELLAVQTQAANDKAADVGDALRKIQQKFSTELGAIRQTVGEKAQLLDMSAYADMFSEWFSQLVTMTDDGGVSDIVGVAVASEEIDESIQELETAGNPLSTSLLQSTEIPREWLRNTQTSEQAEEIQKLEASQVKLWEVASAWDAQHKALPPAPTPAPGPGTPGAAVRRGVGLCAVVAALAMSAVVA